MNLFSFFFADSLKTEIRALVASRECTKKNQTILGLQNHRFDVTRVTLRILLFRTESRAI